MKIFLQISFNSISDKKTIKHNNINNKIELVRATKIINIKKIDTRNLFLNSLI